MAAENIKIVKDKELEKFITEVFIKNGLTIEHASITAKHLVSANLRGVDSHGAIRLKGYIDRIKNGGNNPTPHIKIIKDEKMYVVMDGDNSLGQVGGYEAMIAAIKKANEYGIGIVAMRNSNHYGAAAYYAMMALKYDMIGISMTNVLACMAPTGGIKPKLGNNPVSFAFPAYKRPPVVLDFATSKSSWGKALISKQQNEPLPEGCFMDSQGNPTLDPDTFLSEGTLLPISDYKGYGIALAISIFTCLLSGGKFDVELPHLYNKLNEPGENSFIMAAIKIENFTAALDFKKRLDNIIALMKDTPLIEGVDRIYLPGEKEYEEEQKRLKFGIPLNISLITDLLKIAEVAKIDISQYSFLTN